MSRKLKKSKKKKPKESQKHNVSTASKAKPAASPKIPDYLAVLDFEATCEDRNVQKNWVHEIIEFPVVFLNLATLEVDFIFHSFVRPVETFTLTDFCTNLTGITQEQVDEAPILEEVLVNFSSFLEEHNLKPMFDHPDESDSFTFIFATDGPWDFESFLLTETRRKEIIYPRHASYYVNIRHWYSNCRQLGNGKRHGVNKMLRGCGLRFEGRPHSGLDDAKNIARIARVCFQKKPKLQLKKVKGIASIFEHNSSSK